MDSACARVLSFADLKLYTSEFSRENFIGDFQLGRVYRGKIPPGSSGMEAQEVTVKIWEDPEIYNVCHPEDNVERLMEEVFLLQHPTIEPHPHLAKLIGYCSEGEQLGVVYDLKSLDTVHNLLLEDDFTWLKRIKVALEFACLLEYFHSPYEPYRHYLVRNIDAAHIMLDQDYNAILFDFSMISGGLFTDRRDDVRQLLGCYGYIDPAFAGGGGWSEKSDVFAFGVLLLGLITKRVFHYERNRKNFDDPLLHQWAKSEYKSKKVMGFGWSRHSLVHHSLRKKPEFHSSDGVKITKLAMRCVKYRPLERPTMKQVVDCLLDLRLVRRHADGLCVGQLIRGWYPDLPKANPLEVVRQLICNKKFLACHVPSFYGRTKKSYSIKFD